MNDKMDVMEWLDSDLIDEAGSYKGTKKTVHWLRYGLAAACFGLCALTAAKVYPLVHTTEGISTAETGQSMQGSSAVIMSGGSVQDIDPGNGSANHGGIMPAGIGFDGENAGSDTTEQSQAAVSMMISHYDSSLHNNDLAVNNGCVELSGSLAAAIEEFGASGELYRVVVEVFQDGMMIDSGSAAVALEEERLRENGYTVAHETFEESILSKQDYFTIHAAQEQLLHFPADEAYGYYLSFYDECLGLEMPMEETGQPVNGADIIK